MAVIPEERLADGWVVAAWLEALGRRCVAQQIARPGGLVRLGIAANEEEDTSTPTAARSAATCTTACSVWDARERESRPDAPVHTAALGCPRRTRCTLRVKGWEEHYARCGWRRWRWRICTTVASSGCHPAVDSESEAEAERGVRPRRARCGNPNAARRRRLHSRCLCLHHESSTREFEPLLLGWRLKRGEQIQTGAVRGWRIAQPDTRRLNAN